LVTEFYTRLLIIMGNLRRNEKLDRERAQNPPAIQAKIRKK
jgi:hypothetical protein